MYIYIYICIYIYVCVLIMVCNHCNFETMHASSNHHSKLIGIHAHDTSNTLSVKNKSAKKKLLKIIGR